MLKITEQTGGIGKELVLAGRIDTGDVAALEAATLSAFRESGFLTLNFEKVEYISSAALRVLLIGHKTAVSKGGSMKLTHVSPQVMKALQISAFSNILNIEST